MTGALVDGLSLTDVLLILGVAAVLLDRLAEGRGWSKSSKRLREENADLVRYNDELEGKVARLEQHDREKDKQIAVLEKQVAELQSRDQAAVLAAIETHEANAERRGVENHARHTEAMEVWTSIATHLKGAS